MFAYSVLIHRVTYFIIPSYLSIRIILYKYINYNIIIIKISRTFAIMYFLFTKDKINKYIEMIENEYANKKVRHKTQAF